MARRIKHTPEPWKVLELDAGIGSDEIHVGTDDGAIVAACYPFGGDGVGEQIQEQNAALIVAAPELLSACRLALGSLKAMDVQNATVRLMEAVIAKAEGK